MTTYQILRKVAISLQATLLRSQDDVSTTMCNADRAAKVTQQCW